MFNLSAFVRQYPPDGVNIAIGSDPQELPEDDEVMVFTDLDAVCYDECERRRTANENDIHRILCDENGVTVTR